jgi:hypothetical protein
MMTLSLEMTTMKRRRRRWNNLLLEFKKPPLLIPPVLLLPLGSLVRLRPAVLLPVSVSPTLRLVTILASLVVVIPLSPTPSTLIQYRQQSCNILESARTIHASVLTLVVSSRGMKVVSNGTCNANQRLKCVGLWRMHLPQYKNRTLVHHAQLHQRLPTRRCASRPLRPGLLVKHKTNAERTRRTDVL